MSDYLSNFENKQLPSHLTDAISSDIDKRQKWFDSYSLPSFDIERLKKNMVKINSADNSAYGNVYKASDGDREVVLKFAKGGKDLVRIGLGGVENAMREEYLGLLIAHTISPDIFPEPYGVIRSKKGKIVGFAMEYVAESARLADFWEDSKDNPGDLIFNPRHRPGKELSISFFQKLKSGVDAVVDAGLILTDLHKWNILVDKNMNPKILDVSYYVDPQIAYGSRIAEYLQPKEYFREGIHQSIDYWITLLKKNET